MDLTAITTPFGLLDEETRDTLKAHGGPYEVYADDGWKDWTPKWFNVGVYRVKPAPPKPREWWIAASLMPFENRMAAESWAKAHNIEIIHVREVLPE